MPQSQIYYEIARVLRSKEDAKNSYDRLSKWYDLLTGATEWRFTMVGLELLNAQSGERVLEIGYGTGKALLMLAKKVGLEGYIAGIDISTGMRDIAQERLREAGLQNNVDLRCGDALQLPFVSGRFNAIFISFTLELFDTPEIPLLLTACKNVLCDDGRVVIVAMGKRNHISLSQRIYNWAHNAIPNYADCRPIYTVESVNHAGFYVDTILKKSMWGLPVDVVLAFNSQQ